MKNVQKEIRELLTTVSVELNQPYELVEDIYFHEFRFIGDKMKLGEKDNYPTFENILIKHFGSFIANKKHIDKLKEINDERNNKD